MFFFFSCIVSRLFEAVLTCLALEDKEVNRFRVYYSFLYILKIVPSSVIKREREVYFLNFANIMKNNTFLERC